MSDRPSWFRCDASRLLGALSGMGPDCGYLYTVILMRIYEVGGPIEDDVGTLARRTGMVLRKAASALTWLLAKGKVVRLDDGLLDSETTHEELAYREKLINHARNAGNASAKRRSEFSSGKRQRKQQNRATGVEQSLSWRATGGQPIRVEEEKEEELANASSKRACGAQQKPSPKIAFLGCLSEPTAAAVIEHRRAKKAPLTHRAAQLLAKGFLATGDPEGAAEMMIARGWQGFKPEWYENDKADGRNGISVAEAAKRLHEAARAGLVSFGPIPKPYMPGRNGDDARSNSVVLLPERGSGGSGRLHGGSVIDPGLLSIGGRLSGDGPSHGHSGAQPVASDSGGDQISLRGGNGPSEGAGGA